MANNPPAVLRSNEVSVQRNKEQAAASTSGSKRGSDRNGFRRFLWNNSLCLVLLGLFVVSVLGQTWAGFNEHNSEQQEHDQPAASLREYLVSPHYWEALTENWESEFLQMGMFVILTVFLRQKGSPESKAVDGKEEVDEDPRQKQNDPDAPWAVRRGGWVLSLYSHSLSLAFLLLFLISFFLHAASGSREYSGEQALHGQPGATTLQYIATSRFWFESFQNWQSEFLSIAAMVFLAVYLREKGSAESKPVATPHSENGA